MPGLTAQHAGEVCHSRQMALHGGVICLHITSFLALRRRTAGPGAGSSDPGRRGLVQQRDQRAEPGKVAACQPALLEPEGPANCQRHQGCHSRLACLLHGDALGGLFLALEPHEQLGFCGLYHGNQLVR